MRAIFCADEKWGIGKDNGLLFSLPKDMKFFRETTKGKVVVMGRKTLESFPDGAPLKGRVNIVLSSKEPKEGTVGAKNMQELLALLKNYPAEDVFVIGGESVYRALLPYCEEVLVTKVAADGGADTFVPNLDEAEGFQLAKEGEPVLDNGYTLRFCTYRNTAPWEI